MPELLSTMIVSTCLPGVKAFERSNSWGVEMSLDEPAFTLSTYISVGLVRSRDRYTFFPAHSAGISMSRLYQALPLYENGRESLVVSPKYCSGMPLRAVSVVPGRVIRSVIGEVGPAVESESSSSRHSPLKSMLSAQFAHSETIKKSREDIEFFSFMI